MTTSSAMPFDFANSCPCGNHARPCNVQCSETPLEEDGEDASAKAMQLFKRVATVLKELPRSTGAQARRAGNDFHFDLQDDLDMLKRHWFNFTEGASKENAEPATDTDRIERERRLHRESNCKIYLRQATCTQTLKTSHMHTCV